MHTYQNIPIYLHIYIYTHLYVAIYGHGEKRQTFFKDKVLGKSQTSGIGIESLGGLASMMMQAVPE